ncbi:uncharacterized protein LOC132061453 [Lycium ferocissimum]|uniref:uncharacterized protein LOC132061453 n=1 Tax=Lycium ferocissimum TaxID=112874 RepID=UPI002814B3C3|nr:uncharacterized protein LOC132061453 [Lycium ferocissimum]
MDSTTMPTPKQACWVVRKIFDARKWFPNLDVATALQNCFHKGKFSIKRAYKSFMPQYPKVHWKSLVLGPHLIPRHTFITWLAVQGRLATVDRLQKWGIQVPTDCVLCQTSTVETLSHLFFIYPYSKHIWLALLNWIGEMRQPQAWEEEVKWIAKKATGNRPRAVS